MVGVWIEPVIAQLMIILLAIDVSFPFGTMRKQRIWRMHRLSARCHIPPFWRRPLLSRADAPVCGSRRAVTFRKTAEFRRQDGHNCTLKPKFRRLKRLASPRVY